MASEPQGGPFALLGGAWRAAKEAVSGWGGLDDWAGMGARSLMGEVARLGAALLLVGLVVSVIAGELARRSAADDLADFALIDFLDEEIAPAIAFCALVDQPDCLNSVVQNESRGLWRLEASGAAHSSSSFAVSDLADLSWCEAPELERRRQSFRFFTCRLGPEVAYRIAERDSPAARVGVEYETWARVAARAGERLVGGAELRLAIGVMAAALVLVLGLSLWALRSRLGSHFSRLGAALERYRLGEAPRVDGRYPDEIQSLADSLNRALDKKSALMARQRRNVAKMAHDLRHQLVAIDLAARPGPDGALDRDDLDGELQALTGLVERYLTLTDWVGPAEGAPPVNALEALESARKAFARRLRVEPLEIEVDCPADLALRVHPADLRIILSNLVGNAHRHAKGRVRLSATAAQAAPAVDRAVDPAAGWSAGAVEIAVEDDGPGVPAEKRADVIRWGGRLDAAPAGSGFGLSIVAEQVHELYSGALRLDESKLGGLRVAVTLPRAAVPKAGVEASGSASDQSADATGRERV